MQDLENPKIGPKTEQKGLKKNPRQLVCIKIYFTQEEFVEIAEEAQKAKIRPIGLKTFVVSAPYSQKTVPNTKGVAPFLKRCYAFWKETTAQRAVKRAEIEAKIEELQRGLAENP